MAKTIYILEADEDVQDIMQYILEDSGYEVRLTSSEAIALNIQKVKPDLILLDSWVTQNDPGFCKKLKTAPDTAAVPIILTTTANDPDGLARALMADDVLQKPFGLEDLVAKVDFWLKKIDKTR